MDLPTFSPWLHWDNRTSCEHLGGPGTYVLARFDPSDEVNPLDQRVILVAETHGQSLQKRWDQFHYSAFRGKWGHAGGVMFHGLFGNGPDTATPPWLYVAATPVAMKQPTWLDAVIQTVIDKNDPAKIAQGIANSPEFINAIINEGRRKSRTQRSWDQATRKSWLMK